ncbi:hypothetical protein G6F65_018945 [Rhizopus arrhizus]|nr:hypothetical protein G6F65_018945 [Rhizopus arrhizus]
MIPGSEVVTIDTRECSRLPPFKRQQRIYIHRLQLGHFVPLRKAPQQPPAMGNELLKLAHLFTAGLAVGSHVLEHGLPLTNEADALYHPNNSSLVIGKVVQLRVKHPLEFCWILHVRHPVVAGDGIENHAPGDWRRIHKPWAGSSLTFGRRRVDAPHKLGSTLGSGKPPNRGLRRILRRFKPGEQILTYGPIT